MLIKENINFTYKKVSYTQKNERDPILWVCPNEAYSWSRIDMAYVLWRNTLQVWFCFLHGINWIEVKRALKIYICGACMCVCVCMVAWTLFTCCSLHVDVREWLPAVGSFLLPCMFEELNLVSGLWQAPWPTELSRWLMECSLTFECFTSLPRRGHTSRTCQWNSDSMALD